MFSVLFLIIYLAISFGLSTLTLNGCCRGQKTQTSIEVSVPQRTSILNIQSSANAPKSNPEPEKSALKSDENKGDDKEPSKRDADDDQIRRSFKKKVHQTARIKPNQTVDPTERLSMHGSDMDTQETQPLESSQLHTSKTARSSRRSVKRKNNGKLKSLEATQS